MTCPTTRIHPAIIAQAAATAGLLTGGRFNLGVGTGEALNEHVTGAKWPAAEERQEMLEEAVTIIAELFTGEQLTYQGPHYHVETARLYSVPRVPPPIYVSGFGEKSARLAARIADGYICMGPQADLIKLYRDEGGGDRPVQGGIKGSWAPDAGQARKTMHRLWPNDSIPGESAQLLPLPRHFEQLAQLVTEDMVSAPCGPDPGPYLQAIQAYQEAGFDEIYLGQVGGRLEGAFDFLATQVLPQARGTRPNGWTAALLVSALRSLTRHAADLPQARPVELPRDAIFAAKQTVPAGEAAGSSGDRGQVHFLHRAHRERVGRRRAGQRSSARASWVLFIDERPLMLRWRASE